MAGIDFKIDDAFVMESRQMLFLIGEAPKGTINLGMKILAECKGQLDSDALISAIEYVRKAETNSAIAIGIRCDTENDIKILEAVFAVGTTARIITS